MDEAPAATLDVIEPRNPEGLGFYLKARATGRLFRVEPIRDPEQPRFWCLCIYRCARPRVADPADRPWLGARSLTREELPELLQTIRADVEAWLAQDSCQELRRWLLAGEPAAPTPPPLGRSVAAGAAPTPSSAATTTANGR